MQLVFRHLGLDMTVNPLEALLALLPLDLQHRVAEVLRSPLRVSPADAPATPPGPGALRS